MVILSQAEVIGYAVIIEFCCRVTTFATVFFHQLEQIINDGIL